MKGAIDRLHNLDIKRLKEPNYLKSSITEYNTREKEELNVSDNISLKSSFNPFTAGRRKNKGNMFNKMR
jgi:hypothetical protein